VQNEANESQREMGRVDGMGWWRESEPQSRSGIQRRCAILISKFRKNEERNVSAGLEPSLVVERAKTHLDHASGYRKPCTKSLWVLIFSALRKERGERRLIVSSTRLEDETREARRDRADRPEKI